MLRPLLIAAVFNIFLCSCIKSAAAADSVDGGGRCPWLLTAGARIGRFSAVPGSGWDNLRNKDMAQVAELSFEKCVLSDDAKYVVPQGVILYPKKESFVKVSSELTGNYNNYISSRSMSININGFFSYGPVGIDGKFSTEFQEIREAAVQNKLQIGKSQLRYKLYTARLQPHFALSKAFKNCLSDIVTALVNNQTNQARYLSDKIVADFGTHVVTSVDAGGLVEKLDYFKSNLISQKDFNKREFAASISASFNQLFGVETGLSHEVTDGSTKMYTNSLQKTDVRSFGGAPLGPKPNLNDWVKSLKDNLVPIDRSGKPIYSVISRRSLPNLPALYLPQLQTGIQEAVNRYYKANMIKGCQDPNSRNFDPLANVDGKCDPPGTNYSFAGVYQTCTESNPGASGAKLCLDGDNLPHPLTGAFSCPAEFESVELIRRTSVEHHCYSPGLCTENRFELTAYWCAARRGVELRSSSGMAYGGAYATDKRFLNELTHSNSCPKFFKPYLIGRDINVCLSLDLEHVSPYRIPFGGFFTCNTGNPLADRRLVSYMYSRSRSRARNEALKKCPEGFTQVTLDIVDGCAIMQCIKGRLGLGVPHIRRPPFEKGHYELIERPVTRIEAHNRVWVYNVTELFWKFLGYFDKTTETRASRRSTTTTRASTSTTSSTTASASTSTSTTKRFLD